MRVPANPDPISNPLVAGMESMALASWASILSNTGSPRPTGTLRQTQVMMPPRESLSVLAGIDDLDHLLCRGFMGAAHQVDVHIVSADGFHIRRGHVHLVDGADPCDDFDAMGQTQYFICDSPGGHPPDGFPCTGAAAAAGGARAVLHLIRVVGVRRSRNPAHALVVPRPHVLVGNEQTDGGAQRPAVFHTGKNGDRIGLLAVGGQFALAWPPPVKLILKIRSAESIPGGQPSTMAPRRPCNGIRRMS